MRLVRCSLYTQRKTKCHWIMGFFCLCFTYSLSWGIVALQSCVSFRCTTTWSGIRIHLSPPSWASLPRLPPIPHPTLGSSQSGEPRSLCWAPSAELRISAGRLVTQGSLYMSTLLSQFSPPPPPHVHVHSLPLCLFLPCKEVHLDHFSRFHTYTLIYNICNSLSDLLHSVRQWLHMLFF